MNQDEFNKMIGDLDHCLSLMILEAKCLDGAMDVKSKARQQTLKHHAEDMIAAGQKVLSILNPEKKETFVD